MQSLIIALKEHDPRLQKVQDRHLVGLIEDMIEKERVKRTQENLVVFERRVQENLEIGAGASENRTEGLFRLRYSLYEYIFNNSLSDEPGGGKGGRGEGIEGSGGNIGVQSIALLPELFVKKRTYHLNINSLSRNIDLYSSAAEFKFDPTVYRWTIQSVHFIEILGGTFPNIFKDGSVKYQDVPALHIRLDNLMDTTENYGGTSVSGKGPFAELQFNTDDIVAGGNNLHIAPGFRHKTNYRALSIFNKIRPFTMRLFSKDKDTLYPFGSDVISITSAPFGLLQTTIIFSVPHGLVIGDRIYIRGLSTGNLLLDSVLNSTNGLLAAIVPTSLTIRIPVPSVGFPGISGRVLIGKRNFSFSLIITAIE